MFKLRSHDHNRQTQSSSTLDIPYAACQQDSALLPTEEQNSGTPCLNSNIKSLIKNAPRILNTILHMYY